MPRPSWRRSAPQPGSTVRAGDRRRLVRLIFGGLLGSAALAAAGGGVAVLVWPSIDPLLPARLERMTFALPTQPSLAVQPFRAAEGESVELLLLGGLTDDLRDSVARFPGLLVVAGATSSAYGDPALSRHEVAEALGVAYLLEGEVRRRGERLLVEARLLDMLAGKEIWRERFERDPDALPSLRNDIAAAVAVRLLLEDEVGAAQRLAGPLPRSFESWRLLLMARERFRRLSPADNVEARRLAERALAEDPELAAAHALVAWSHYLEYRFRWSDDISQAAALAFAAAQRALAEDPYEAHANWLVGRLLLWTRQYADSTAAYQRALQRSPNNADILRSWADTLIFMGEPAQAVTPARQAMRLNPEHPSSYPATLAWALFLTGDAAGAVLLLAGRAPLSSAGHQLLAAAYAQLGRRGKAGEHVKVVLADRPRFSSSLYARSLPFRRDEDRTAWIEALQAAGFPP